MVVQPHSSLVDNEHQFRTTTSLIIARSSISDFTIQLSINQSVCSLTHSVATASNQAEGRVNKLFSANW